jgi:TolB-like protein
VNTQNIGVESTEDAGDRSLAAVMVPGPEPGVGERHEKATKRSRRKAAKLRAVWISFTGRIVAQFVGSAASILLGMMLIHSYKAPVQGAEKVPAAAKPVSYQGRVARTTEAGRLRRAAIVVLPVVDYSEAVPGDHFSQALTELVTASLAERDAFVVLSRTSASHIGAGHGSVPAIARELGVDLVLESSVTRSGNGIRVIAQLIDGRSDEHLWTGRYDRESGNSLSVQDAIADEIVRGIDAAVGGSAVRPTALASRDARAAGGPGLDASGRVALRADPPARIQ